MRGGLKPMLRKVQRSYAVGRAHLLLDDGRIFKALQEMQGERESYKFLFGTSGEVEAT